VVVVVEEEEEEEEEARARICLEFAGKSTTASDNPIRW
jgi:hypothetical protein